MNLTRTAKKALEAAAVKGSPGLVMKVSVIEGGCSAAIFIEQAAPEDGDRLLCTSPEIYASEGAFVYVKDAVIGFEKGGFSITTPLMKEQRKNIHA